MKQYLLVILFILLSSTTRAQNKECSSDASWEETMIWLNENITLKTVSDSDLFSIEFRKYNLVIGEEVSSSKEYDVAYIINLKGLNELILEKNRIRLKNIDVKYFFYKDEDKDEQDTDKPNKIYSSHSIIVNNQLLRERAYKALSHLVHLNDERNKKSKANSKF